MKVEYINPFIVATKNAFETMLGLDINRSDLFASEESQPTNDITGIIGLSGRANGSIALGMSKELAIKSTEMLAMIEVSELNEEVVDAVGELANMVAGAAKAQLEELEMSITLPTILLGRESTIQFPSGTPTLCVCFDSEWGNLTLQVGLVEE